MVEGSWICHATDAPRPPPLPDRTRAPAQTENSIEISPNPPEACVLDRVGDPR